MTAKNAQLPTSSFGLTCLAALRESSVIYCLSLVTSIVTDVSLAVMSGSVSKVTSKTKLTITEDQPTSEFSSKTSTSDLTEENLQHLEDQHRSTTKLSNENSIEVYIRQMQLSTIEKSENNETDEEPVEVLGNNQSLPQLQHFGVNCKDSETMKRECDSVSETDDTLTVREILNTSQPPDMTKSEVSTTAVSTVQQEWKANCTCHHGHLSGCQAVDSVPLITLPVQTQTEWSWLNQSHVPDLSDAIKVNTYGITETLESGPGHLKTQHGSADKSRSDIPVLGAISCSEELHLTHDKQHQARVQTPSDHYEAEEVTCEFCCQMAKSFPSREQLATEPAEKLFCCSLYQDLYYYLLREQDTVVGESELIDIFAHKTFISNQAQKEAIERAAQRMWEKKQEQCRTFSENSHFISDQTATISYQLSSTFCMEQGWTLPFPPFEELEVDDVFIPPSDLCEKYLKGHHGLLQKLYPNGQPFFILFSDGTGQVFYFSGNLAIAITSALPTMYTFIVLEDHDTCPRIQAVFKSNGHSTCYHPNGVIWVNLTPHGGCCLDTNGTRRKRWQWRDFSHHVHAPPIQPISLSLNSNIGIRIISQEQVYVTFTTKRTRVKFNMGARLVQLKCPEKLTGQKPDVSEEEHLLQCKTLKILALLDKMQDVIKHSLSVPVFTVQSKHQDSSALPITVTDEEKKADFEKKTLKSARK